MDLIVAHGIWNLAATTAQCRAAVGEAGRIARPAAGFVPDDTVAFSECNLPRPGQIQPFARPVIFEAVFRRAGGRSTGVRA